MFHIGLNISIIESTTNKTFGVEDGVCGVHSDLVFGSITDKTFGVSECNIRRRGSVTLVIGNDF